MSRFGDDDGAEYNAADLWATNVRRALNGKRGRKALADLREALMALPERRLIGSAICTAERGADVTADKWTAGDYQELVEHEGVGVCAVGAFAWHRKVKQGMAPNEAFAALPLGADYDEGAWRTAEVGVQAGLTSVLAWELAWLNDERFGNLTPEARFDAVLAWIDEQLAKPPLTRPLVSVGEQENANG